MASKDTVGIFNNTQRIIALKGQVPLKDSAKEARRFCDRLAPGILSFVPKAFWSIYKRNKVVQAMLDSEKLIVNKKPTTLAEKEVIPQKTAEEIKQEAVLRDIENSGE